MKDMKTSDVNDLNEREIRLFNNALNAYKNAYAPYSNFHVGAALFDNRGNIFSGCNVESVDMTLTTHAEMAAIDAMVKSGSREISELLIVMKTNEESGMPCGLCRQKIIEFTKSNIPIISVNINDNNQIVSVSRTNISELLPFPFTKSNLQ